MKGYFISRTPTPNNHSRQHHPLKLLEMGFCCLSWASHSKMQLLRRLMKVANIGCDSFVTPTTSRHMKCHMSRGTSMPSHPAKTMINLDGLSIEQQSRCESHWHAISHGKESVQFGRAIQLAAVMVDVED